MQRSLQTSYSYRPSATSQLLLVPNSHCCLRRPLRCSSRCCTGADQSGLVHIPNFLPVFQSFMAIPPLTLHAKTASVPGLSMQAPGTAEQQIPPARPQGTPGHYAARAGGITGCSKAPQMLSHQVCCILDGSFCSLLPKNREHGLGSSVPLLE